MSDDVTLRPASASALAIEENGINVIDESERKGHPRELFWPWFGANISFLGMGSAAWALASGVSFVQGVITGLIGIVLSFLLCGIIALAGKRGSAPTMTLSRRAYGVRGNRMPSAFSWVVCVGWETILTATAVKATVTVFEQMGWSGGGGTGTKVIAMVIVAALVVGGGVIGFNLIMRMQAVITVLTGVLTIVVIALSAKYVHWHAVTSHAPGGAAALVSSIILLMTYFGLGWVNVAADYSRYLPRSASSAGVVGWTTFGGAIAPALLFIYGLLLVGSSGKLLADFENNPVGALAVVLPKWFLLPFLVVALAGLVGGAVLDIYSSGLALLSAGLKIPRFVAAGVDGVIMLAGTVYLVFFNSDSFLSQFEGFLTTVSVLIASWTGVFLADLFLHREDYSDRDLFDPRGRYGDVQGWAVATTAIGAVVGWGLMTNGVSWLTWQGYLLGPFHLGGKTGEWAYASLGVVVALVLTFVLSLGYTVLLEGRRRTAPVPLAT